jgi:signal peptidase II
VNHGAVVDFLDVFIGENHWPAFNLADSAICLGVAILLLVPAKQRVLYPEEE